MSYLGLALLVAIAFGFVANARAGRPVSYLATGVLLGLDILVNAFAGGEHYTTISCRIGESIVAGGWAARVPWPARVREHFLNSVYETTV